MHPLLGWIAMPEACRNALPRTACSCWPARCAATVRHQHKSSEVAQDTYSCNELGQVLAPDKDAYCRNLKCQKWVLLTKGPSVFSGH